METTLVAERERKRLAAELHDSPMQKLAIAQAQIVSAARSRDEESDRLLEVGLELLRDALAELRSLQFELSPPLLYQAGLGPALEWLAANATRRYGAVLSYLQAGSGADLGGELSVVLFQSARELVHNLVRHADASQGSIELAIHDGEVLLAVSDNGKGIPSSGGQPTTACEGGYGFFSVRERLALLGGDLAVMSDGGGTRATVRVPLKTGAANRRWSSAPEPASQPSGSDRAIP